MDVVVPVSTPVPPAPPAPPAPSIWQRFSGAGTAIGLAAVVVFLVVSNWPKSPVQKPDVPPVVLVDPAVIYVSGSVGKMTPIRLPDTIDLNGSSLWWLNPSPANLQVAEYPDHVMVCPQTTGSIYFAAEVYNTGRFQRVTWIILSGTGPQPPPDVPPVIPPVIPPVVPPDVPPVIPPVTPPVNPPLVLTPFELRLQAAYTPEANPAQRLQLVQVYRQGFAAINDSTITTAGGLYARLVAIATKADKAGTLPKTALKNTKQVIADEMKLVQTNPLTVLDTTTRTSFANEMKIVADGLERIRP